MLDGTPARQGGEREPDGRPRNPEPVRQCLLGDVRAGGKLIEADVLENARGKPCRQAAGHGLARARSAVHSRIVLLQPVYNPWLICIFFAIIQTEEDDMKAMFAALLAA